MTETELQTQLRRMKRWRPGLTLEPFEWLTEEGPSGAFADVSAYLLIDPEAGLPRDDAGRNWEPVLVVGQEVLVGASPALLDALLAGAGFFARVEAFSEDLVFQMHRFALDFYQGCQVREEELTRAPDQLVVRGQAYLGGGPDIETVQFETRAGPGRPAVFSLER